MKGSKQKNITLSILNFPSGQISGNYNVFLYPEKKVNRNKSAISERMGYGISMEIINDR